MTTTKPSTCGRRFPVCRTSGSFASRPATISGRWATPGPCGPCSEIFYDHGDHIPGGPPGSPDADGDRFVEIWNLVFMQYEALPGGERVNLPRPSIDTGMGLERIAAVLQGVHDNYDIDLFRALIRAIADLTGVDPDGPQRASHRVIADHLRASAFLVADGVLPSNEGRGYVLRRIMRRAMRHAQIAWRARPADVAPRPGADPRDGPGLSRAHPRRGADHRDAETRGDALPHDAGARPRHPRGRDAVACARAACFPARPRSSSTTPTVSRSTSRRTPCARGGFRVDVDGFQRRDGAPARGGAPRLGRVGRGGDRDRLVRPARAGRRDRVPRLRDRDRRRRRAGDRQGRRSKSTGWKPARRAR